MFFACISHTLLCLRYYAPQGRGHSKLPSVVCPSVACLDITREAQEAQIQQDGSQCHQNYSHQMPDFSFKMHQIQFQLELRPRPMASSQRSPRPPSWIWGREQGDKREGETEALHRPTLQETHQEMIAKLTFRLVYLFILQLYINSCSL